MTFHRSLGLGLSCACVPLLLLGLACSSSGGGGDDDEASNDDPAGGAGGQAEGGAGGSGDEPGHAGSPGVGGESPGGSGPAGGAGGGDEPDGVPVLTRAVDSANWGAPYEIVVPAGLALRPGGTQLLTMPKLDKPLPAGGEVSRTMGLLRASTAARPSRLKVLFYGQSITRQVWYEQVIAWFEATYPTVDFEFAMLAAGGKAAAQMRRASEHDVIPMQPDLIIYQNYGDYIDIDAIIRDWRTRTTAEVVLLTWHLGNESGDSFTSTERMSYLYMPNVCERYGCYLLDVRTAWKDYVKAKGIANGALTSDGVHLNQEGIDLMAKLVIDVFKNHPQGVPADPLRMVEDYEVGKDVKWSGGKLVADFDGQHIEVVAAADASISAGAATVAIDGKAPSAFAEAYAFTRPNGSGKLIDKPEPGWPWALGAPMRIDHNAKLQVEDWTLEITSRNGNNFQFTVAGSKTGPDGMGSNTAKFTSTSGRVVISPNDWHTNAPNGGFNITTNQVVWKAIAVHSDVYPPQAVAASPSPAVTTLIQNLPKGRHRVEIASKDGKALPIKALRVHRPALGR